jgi:hypothetical protein
LPCRGGLLRRRTKPKLPCLAIGFIVIGDGTSIHCAPYSAADVGKYATTGVPVTATGVHDRAAGDQGMQAGQDATTARADDHPSERGWWMRLRERDMIVAIATIVGAIAVVIGTAVAICTSIGWTP